MLVPLFSWSRVEAILENRNFSEVALSVDGLVELVYELVNSSCMLYIVSTITMTLHQTALLSDRLCSLSHRVSCTFESPLVCVA